MDAGYQVVIDKIRHTGQAAGKVAGELRAAGCAATLPAGDLGMSGAQAVAKMAQVVQALIDHERGFENRLDTHAANMAKAADLYSHQETAATTDITPVTGTSHLNKAV